MDASTLRTISQPSSSSSNSFTARACDCASAFGRKVAPLTAGAFIAWLSVTAAPTIGVFCLAAGAVWTGCLVIRALCSYVISVLYSDPESESFNEQLKEHLNISFKPIINKRKNYSLGNEHLVDVSRLAFDNIDRQKIICDFEKDFTRPMSFSAECPNGVSYFYTSGDKWLHFIKEQDGRVLQEIKLKHSDLNKLPAQSEASEGRHSFDDNKKKLEAACHGAFAELSNEKGEVDDLAAAAMDLTIQTVGTAMWEFTRKLYSDLCFPDAAVQCEGNPVISFGIRTGFTELKRGRNGIINVKANIDVPRCIIKIRDYRTQRVYQVEQQLLIETSVTLDPRKLDQREFGQTTVKFGKLLSFFEEE